MKTPKILILTAITLILACGPASAAKLQTTVSIAPLKHFVEKIGGENVAANIMVKLGSSPATYEPQPRQMAQLSKSEVYFAIGVPFEQAWLPRFKSASKELEIVNLGDGIVHQTMKAHIHHDEEHHGEHHTEHGHKPTAHHEEHDHDHEPTDHHENHDHNHSPKATTHHAKHDHGQHVDIRMKDPHVWLSPPLVRIICQEIRDTLIKHDPENADTYNQNYLNFAKEINKLDSDLLNTFLNKGKHFSFMVYHPSWGYFARTYGLTQLPIELEGKEPSPKELTQLIKLAKQQSVQAIFVQPQFSQKSAKAIASSIGAKVLVADPLAEDWEANMRKVAKTFTQNH